MPEVYFSLYVTSTGTLYGCQVNLSGVSAQFAYMTVVSTNGGITCVPNTGSSVNIAHQKSAVIPISGLTNIVIKPTSPSEYKTGYYILHN